MEWVIKIKDKIYDFDSRFNTATKRNLLYKSVYDKNGNNFINITCARCYKDDLCGAKLDLNFSNKERLNYYISTSKNNEHKQWCVNYINDKIISKRFKNIISVDLINNFYKNNIIQIREKKEDNIFLLTLNYEKDDIFLIKNKICSKNVKRITIDSAQAYFFEVFKKNILKKGLSMFEDDYKHNCYDVYNNKNKSININLIAEKLKKIPIKFNIVDFTSSNYDSFDENGNLIITIKYVDFFRLEKNKEINTKLLFKKIKPDVKESKLVLKITNKYLIDKIIKLKNIAKIENSNSKLNNEIKYGLSFLTNKERHIDIKENELILSLDVLEYEQFFAVTKNNKYQILDEFIDSRQIK
ncbi:hypothetical protein SHELI_v1c05220 [Spiroplasma helicoides]|uniref:Uncharacterized protein n=1 Tax=Spiroplasma helicoides TaxID=216938 RepID=A0A1B3SKM2_9MOLU|nr:hypothetical protein [Spiroplasma helicoides]AOG60473.1 hypothetical protein SHELI_v1c05220 [Spiroplasma helicoides]